MNRDQKAVFGIMMESLQTRGSENSTITSKGKLFWLQERAGSGNRYTFQPLIQYAESKRHIFLITVGTESAVSLFENDRIPHNLLTLWVDCKDCTDATDSGSSKYGLHFGQPELLGKASLIIVGEASMMDSRLLEMVDVTL